MQIEPAKIDGDAPAASNAAWTSAKVRENKVECNACPVLCQISPGKAGACDRYANANGRLIRVDPVLLFDSHLRADDALPTDFGPRPDEPDAEADAPASLFMTGVGASTRYPEYHPAPFIVSSTVAGVDMVTAVTEGIFSYCSMRIKIDTDRFIGVEGSPVRYKGEHIGHVATVEYGSRMISLGGVDHLTGATKIEGRMTTEAIVSLGNKLAVQMTVDNGPSLRLRAGDAPLIDSIRENLMRVGCGAATIGMFAKQWQHVVDEVIVVDDHITGLLTEHRAGKGLGMRSSGIRLKGRRSTPGRYFQVAGPGTGWGGTDIVDPLSIIDTIDRAVAWPGMRLLAVSTTGEHALWYEFDEDLTPRPRALPDAVQAVVDRLKSNCEPSLTTVMFVVGAGGSLRAGITDNPVLLTRAVKSGEVKVTLGGAPAYVWPGGGITVMVDVHDMPDMAFGTVPTPAIVAPIEFTMSREVFAKIEGHVDAIRPITDVLSQGATHAEGAPTGYRRLAPGGTKAD